MLTLWYILAVVGFVLAYLYMTSYRRKNLPPGPFRFPIIGNLIQLALINHKEPWLAFTKLGEKYGDRGIMSFQLGSIYTVVLNSYELMEEHLTKSEFSDRYWNAWMEERTYNKRLGLVEAKYPEPWHELRKFSLRTLREFGYGKRNRMQSVIETEITELVKELKTSVKENNGIHFFNNFFNLSILNVVWSMLAGKRYDHTDEKLLRLLKVLADTISAASFASIGVAYPQWKDWFSDWTGMTTRRICFKELNAFAQQFIDERRKLGVYKTGPENLIDEFLLEAEAHKGEPNSIYSDEQLVTIMNDFFIAGSDTTSNTLTWCVIHLMLNPRVQKKLQEEIDLVLPNGTFPTAEHESELHYLRATLAETHRMGTVGPLMLPRATTKDTECGKYFIPKGTYVIGNIHGIHYDESYWKDPKIFRPERFIDADGKFKNDVRVKPFGFGKRGCPGEPLASLNLTIYVAELMRNFSLSTVPGEPLPPVDAVPGITIGPRPFRAIIKCRQ